MKRVAYVSTDPGVPVFGSKGASVHVQAVVRELLRRGTEVHLVTARLGGDLPRGLGGVVVHELPRITGTPGREREESARRSARAAADVLARVHSDTPLDLVMERYSLWSDAAMTWARACDVPGVLEVNSPLVDEQAQHRVLADRVGAEAIARRAFDAADSVVAVSEPVARWVLDRTDNRNVTVVPNGVDTRYIRPGLEGRPQAASHLDQRGEPRAASHLDQRGEPQAASHLDQQTPFVIGFVGTLKPWHGVEVLVESFARLAPTDDGTRLRLVGDGPQRAAIEAQAERLGVADRVDLVGAVAPERMPEELARMDLAVAPYPQLPDFYFSPLKLYEYLAAGLPVVASDIGPVGEVLDGGHLGVLVTPGDVTELAAALAGLRSDAALRAELGDLGRRAAVSRHDWSLVVSRILTTVPVRPPSLADDLLGRSA
ncbi:glycosyltransferase family 4 protein [Janibacter indicus]|uniref:Glycosyltransferase involved in cell wall bisynthesis n=1 Tax=Janibacter indicus TaxID=857417 RepID=A0A1W2A7E5_9MICO|nr:glycosyltransferase family 4 protein [Janibacter indicus]SMC56341.1 Glycosyltransferase involved in cell wall bisynthesis [Janibacter indicus]